MLVLTRNHNNYWEFIASIVIVRLPVYHGDTVPFSNRSMGTLLVYVSV